MYLSLFDHIDPLDFCVFAMVHRLSYGAIMRTELFIYFCSEKYIGTQGEVCRQLKIFYTPRLFMLLTVLRRRSQCCSYSVWLCGLYYGMLHVLKSSRALFVIVFLHSL